MEGCCDYFQYGDKLKTDGNVRTDKRKTGFEQKCRRNKVTRAEQKNIQKQRQKQRSRMINQEANSYRRMVSLNKYKFLQCVKSMQKIRSAKKNILNYSPSPTKSKHKSPINPQDSRVLYQKIKLYKNSSKETPLILIEGKISIMRKSNQLAYLEIPKIINYSSKLIAFVSCRVIAVQKAISNCSWSLKSNQYEIALGAYLPALKPMGSLKHLQISGKWIKPTKYNKFYLLLMNQITNQVLYASNCYNLCEISSQAMKYIKLDQIIL